MRSATLRNIIAGACGCSLLLTFAGLSRSSGRSQSSQAQSTRGQLGVYAKVDIEAAINGFKPPPMTAAEEHNDIRTLFADLLSNPAISGITVGQRWDNIQVSDPETATDASGGYDWSFLDDAFAEAQTAQKSVNLIITPGVNSPPWLLAKLPSCDGLLGGGTASSDCGKATFEGFPEQEQRADSNTLPLPWNSVYQQAWDDFLTHLAARYNSNPLFVSIAVAGPICASDEMILPTDLNTATQPSGLSANNTWTILIGNSFPSSTNTFQHSDQVFIDSWKQAIDAYQRIFSGVTLVISADSGSDLPNFSHNVTLHTDNILYAEDCAVSVASTDPGSRLYKDLMSCEAKTEILSYFVAAGGPNGKSTRVGGMTASSPRTLVTGDIGIGGVKLLTSLLPAPMPPFSGGAEFDHPVSGDRQGEGCQDPNAGCPGLTIEEAAYNVLTVFFNDTPAAQFYNGTVGTAHVQYLEVPYVDVQYAEAHSAPVTPSPVTGNMSLQDLLNKASHDLFAMAGPLISSVVFDGAKKLTISGMRFGSNPHVTINGADRSGFIMSTSDTAILLKAKQKKLGLVAGDNTIQIIDAAGTGSNMFILRL